MGLVRMEGDDLCRGRSAQGLFPEHILEGLDVITV